MSRALSAKDRPYHVSVSNEQKRLKLDRRRLIEAVRTTLGRERVSGAEISIALLDDEAIRPINLAYLNHDYAPDVLSFLLEESGGDETGGFSERGAGKILSGEILIGVEEAMRVAKKFDWPAEDEVLLYLVHGLLHLCGYDDLSPAEKRIMRRREKEILGLWGLSVPYQNRKSRPDSRTRKETTAQGNVRPGGRQR